MEPVTAGDYGVRIVKCMSKLFWYLLFQTEVIKVAFNNQPLPICFLFLIAKIQTIGLYNFKQHVLIWLAFNGGSL